MKMKYQTYEEIIKNNREWASEKLSIEPSYFETLSRGQKPPFLFIGCSDSRMALDTITKTEPGELFIHRNIANQISLTDMNLLSVLEYAIGHLKVKHIIVCGHYCCGGVTAALEGNAEGLVESWLMPIRELYRKNKKELDEIEDLKKRSDKLSEMNVILQVKNLCKTSVMRKVFKGKDYPKIHAWVIDIYIGRIKELKIPVSEFKERELLPKDYKY